MNFYLMALLYGVQVFKIVMLTLYLWQSKLYLSVLLNRMVSPQNCSHHKLTLVKLTLYLQQITVKFNITPLTVIKVLPSLTLNL